MAGVASEAVAVPPLLHQRGHGADGAEAQTEDSLQAAEISHQEAGREKAAAALPQGRGQVPALPLQGVGSQGADPPRAAHRPLPRTRSRRAQPDDSLSRLPPGDPSEPLPQRPPYQAACKKAGREI